MKVDPNSPIQGVNTRLAGAMIAGAVTLICMIIAITQSMSSFTATFAFTLGVSSFGMAVSLLMSARHEEEVHELASKLDAQELLPAGAGEPDVIDWMVDEPAMPADQPVYRKEEPPKLEEETKDEVVGTPGKRQTVRMQIEEADGSV